MIYKQNMDLSLVPEICIIILTLIVFLALVPLCLSAQHKYSVIFISILIVEYAFELLRVLYFVKYYWNSTHLSLYFLPVKRMPAVSMICSVLLGTIILTSLKFKQSSLTVACFIYSLLSLTLITVWNNLLGTCLITDKYSFYAFDDSRLNTAFYCYEKLDPWTSGYFLEYLLLSIPTLAVLYDKLYKTSSFSELWYPPSKETCPICRFNIVLYNHILALALLMIWCVRPTYFLFIAFGSSFRVASIYIDLFIMISSMSCFILVLMNILRFYLFRKVDFSVDNVSEYSDVIENCGLPKERSIKCEQNDY